MMEWQPNPLNRPAPGAPRIDRRRFLALATAGLAVASRSRADDSGTPAAVEKAEADARRSAEERAKGAGIGPLKVLKSAHFQALGDAPEGFLRLVLADCEDVAADFLPHFTARGFAIALPPARMTVVALADDATYGRFFGERPSLASGGRYDFKNDRLIVYDYRPARGRMGARPGPLNLLTLTHEVTHQLCFDGGIFDRDGDAPRIVVEGLATYAEPRLAGPRPTLGRRNDTRLDDLAHLRRGTPWIPIRDLIASDDAILGRQGGGPLLLAYAQSWLFAYVMMTDHGRLPGYRDYLRAIRPRRDASHRVDDATAHLGDLDRLDADLKRESVRLLKSR